MARGTAGQAALRGACRAKKRGGGKCQLAAGFGTNHLGIGRCKFHGGSVPNQVKAAATEEYRILLGKPVEINPLEALIKCIHIRAGEVEWLSDRMAELDQRSWVEDTMVGKQFHLYARERRAALNDLARFSQMAVSLGIAERAVKLAENYGHTLARLLKGIFEDLQLSTEQQAMVPGIVRKHLILIEGGAQDVPPTIDGTGRQKELVAAS